MAKRGRANINLTKTRVDAIPHPQSGQKLYWDSELSGFGVRVTPGSKTYFVEARVDGRTSRVSLASHLELTAEAARREAKKHLGDMSRGINLNHEKAEKRARALTLAELFEQYIAAKTLRPKTLIIYKSVLNRCFQDWLDKPITNISKDMIEKRHRELSNINAPKGKGEAQANQAMRTLRSLLNYAAAVYEDSDGRSILPENPVKRLSQVNAWNRAVRRQSVIHKHQLRPWIDAVKQLNSTMRDYMLLCLFTGLRRNEAARLKWEDIDFKAGYLCISGEATKNHEEHRLPLSDFVHGLLKQRHDNKKHDDIYVFPGTGEGGHLVECKRSVAKVSKISGVKFMMHDLRRTFLTIAEGLDIPHYALKRLVNHKTSSDVTSGYIAADVERLREPMQRITDYILEEAGLQKRKSKKTRQTETRMTDSHAALRIAK